MTSRSDNPITGDENNIFVWIVLVLVAVATALTVRCQFKSIADIGRMPFDPP